MNKEANMKTVLEIAKECGGVKSFISDGYFLLTEAQLTATIEAWNRQNSEPIGHIYRNSAGQISIQASKSTAFDMSKYVGCSLFTKPPQPLSVRDALEMALSLGVQCNAPSNYSQAEKHAYDNGAIDYWKAIRALIDQPEPPASQELTDYVDRLEAALNHADQFISNGIELGYIRMPDEDTPDSAKETPAIIYNALQSKPAKG